MNKYIFTARFQLQLLRLFIDSQTIQAEALMGLQPATIIPRKLFPVQQAAWLVQLVLERTPTTGLQVSPRFPVIGPRAASMRPPRTPESRL